MQAARNPVACTIFIATGGLCPGVTVGEWLSAPLNALQTAETTNYNTTSVQELNPASRARMIAWARSNDLQLGEDVRRDSAPSACSRRARRCSCRATRV
jgi:hypothetical protein